MIQLKLLIYKISGGVSDGARTHDNRNHNLSIDLKLSDNNQLVKNLHEAPMLPVFLSKSDNTGFRSCKLSLLLLMVFPGKQFINFDSIGWSNGFAHPLTGWDHLITMLAVGIWAAQLRGQAIWMLPLAFVGVMSLGGLAGAAGLAIPCVEGIILLSCAVFSVLITHKVRFSSKINVLIVAFFAFFHGFAHGQEISTSASLISYTLGFMLATLLLHGAGILVAKLVMLAITCLLTALFSSVALSKVVESSIHLKDKSTAFAQEAGVDKISSFWKATNQRGYEIGYFVFDEDNISLEGFSRYRSGGGGPSSTICKAVTTHANSVKTPLESFSENNKADSGSHALILKNTPLQALDNCQDKQSFELDYISDSRLDFKHYFPDINHTPGKYLLSNGVGLTSPPPVQFTIVLVPQITPKRYKNSTPFIEESSLQWIFARFATGSPDTQATALFTHNYAVRNLPSALLLSFTASRCNRHCVLHLTPSTNSIHSISLAADEISRFHWLIANPRKLAIDNVGYKADRAPTIPQNIRNQQDILL